MWGTQQGTRASSRISKLTGVNGVHPNRGFATKKNRSCLILMRGSLTLSTQWGHYLPSLLTRGRNYEKDIFL